MKPRYEKRCSRFCVDSKGARRAGNQWVHVYGRTLWVCDSCARQLFKKDRASGPEVHTSRTTQPGS